MDVEVLIVGAGFGGIGAAIELRKEGIEDFLVVDKNDDVGGTWHVNTYPGVSVDVPSVFYSFSYAPPRTWSQFFETGAAVQEYAAQVVDDFGLRERIRLNTAVVEANWDEQDDVWRVGLDSGETLVCRFLILGVGGLEVPRLPDIAGIEEYEGKLVHTARWDHEYDYRDKHVAVIGTGASALQLIPELAAVAGRLTVFQRRPIWVAPKPDFAVPQWVSSLLLRFPLLRRAIRAFVATEVDVLVTGLSVFHGRVPFVIPLMQRLGRLLYRFWLRDDELARRLTPDYAPFCKRPSISNTYLGTFLNDHVELVTEPIEKVADGGLVTADGVLHAVDVLVCATGFQVMAAGATPPFPTRGRGGLDLNTFWQEHRFQAYQGVSVPRFPNLFMITGPYAYPGGSAIAMIECTSRHAARAIGAARARAATAVEIRPEPHDRYWQKCLRRSEQTIWLSRQCAGSGTYVVNEHGDAAFIRPSLHWEMWWGNKHFPLDHYSYR